MADGTLLIEDGVPIPRLRSHGGRIPGPITAAIQMLRVGQSVHVPGKRTGQMGAYVKIARAKHQERKFCCRAERDGCRVWRTA